VREGSVKGKVILCSAGAPLRLPEKVEDQGSGNLTLNHLSVEDRSTNHRFGPYIDHDSSMRTSRRRAGAKVENGFLFSKARLLRRLLHGPLPGCESAHSIQRSSLRRPGPPAGCSRCERSLDTVSRCVASSRVVPLTCAPPPPSPHPLASDDNDANTVCEVRDHNALRSAPLPPATSAAAGCLVSKWRLASAVRPNFPRAESAPDNSLPACRVGTGLHRPW